VLSKSDMLGAAELEKCIATLKEAVGEREVLTISILDDELVKAFSDRLASLLKSKV
jgi:ethanolamine utilization protein EutP (predicted NTPase)